MSNTTVSVLATAAIATSVGWIYHQRWKSKLERIDRIRSEERTGRIRAEIKLRTVLKENQQLSTRTESVEAEQNKTFLLHSIGSIVSPYTKRMGTPRQPQLCPSSRGYIQFTVLPGCLDGINEYSHIWIIFEFHANTNIDAQRKTKIRPPRSPHKVGQLATRSPHRPNPLGLSLATVDHWDSKLRRLHVRGLDLVHSTPVYDIKPCVPWDIPGYRGPESTPLTSLTVPEWVRREDAIPNVEFTEDAMKSLDYLVDEGRLPLYKNDTEAASQTIKEILAQDPRSSHKGVEARGSIGEYNVVFERIRVYFTVTSDKVTVTSVESISFAPESFVDGVPLLLETDVA